MTIKLHNVTISCQRYIQLETQPYHVVGIWKKITKLIQSRKCDFDDIKSVYYECEEDGTITFYEVKGSLVVSLRGLCDQGQIAETDCPGIWTYMLYSCPQGQEIAFRDESVNNSIESLKEILAGNKLVQTTVEIKDYLRYQYYDGEYLDVRLPPGWDYPDGIEISNLLLEEFAVFQTSSIFSSGVGKAYMKIVLDKFAKVAYKIVEKGGYLQEFQTAQYDILQQMNTNEIAQLIVEYNDYRIWQISLPSKSKAVEHAFNSALDLLAKI
ncbi:hypothetical protein [Calothrix sp. PCC 6303]|uniref:hypothetical protein n=1 Tax=Calothrix sp. PCC 6303 TaxID=1170562 RepID=UPI0002A02F81|nr:hypothetical protein [Calothrix sp. PCC 6303]AFY99905.1 hypothetical protein Cal6303_0840 [Calothrix sp. PCC 6303]